jgi:hypothetical protein
VLTEDNSTIRPCYSQRRVLELVSNRVLQVIPRVSVPALVSCSLRILYSGIIDNSYHKIFLKRKRMVFFCQTCLNDAEIARDRTWDAEAKAPGASLATLATTAQLGSFRLTLRLCCSDSVSVQLESEETKGIAYSYS